MAFFAKRFFRLINRNAYSREGKKSKKGTVNLEFYRDDVNLGDYLSEVVVKYMLNRRDLSLESPSYDKSTKHLMAIGSILGGSGEFNATVWGSGIRNFSSVKSLSLRKYYQKLDIRAVRGPFTRDALLQCGFNCVDVYGDPAIIMPCIYSPQVKEKKGVVLILHYLTPHNEYMSFNNVKILDIKTTDYKTFIDTVSVAELVISSSLHGIILSEVYGTKAIFLSKGIESETIKFYDWYYSTGRKNVIVASSLEEALRTTPMELPNLLEMREQLINTFPYDLWNK